MLADQACQMRVHMFSPMATLAAALAAYPYHSKRVSPDV